GRSGADRWTPELEVRHDPDRGSGDQVAMGAASSRAFPAQHRRARTPVLEPARHRYDSEVPRMDRQNLFSDTWDGENEEERSRRRIFWRPDDARLGATLYELAPVAPESRMHMHFGAEEMFFVLSGHPLFRNRHGTEELAPGDFVFCPEGRAGVHAFS